MPQAAENKAAKGKTASANPGGATGTAGKFNKSQVKKEVEENPFKKLIDISDLMEIEQNQEET